MALPEVSPNTVEETKEIVKSLAAENARLHAENARLRIIAEEIERLIATAKALTQKPLPIY